MKRKNLFTSLIFIILANLVLASNVYASTVNLTTHKIHSAVSPNYSYVSFRVNVDYNVNVYDSVESGQEYQVANNHDFYSYVSFVTMAGAGSQNLWSAELLNSSGTSVAKTSSFSIPELTARMIDTTTCKQLLGKHSYSALKQSPFGNYRIQLNTTFWPPETFTPINFGEEWYTSWF